VLVEAQLAGQVRDEAADRDAIVPAVVSVDGGAAGGGAEEAQEQPQSGRLARAVGPEQAEDLAAVDPQRQAVEGAEGAVVLRQAVGREERFSPRWVAGCWQRAPPCR